VRELQHTLNTIDNIEKEVEKLYILNRYLLQIFKNADKKMQFIHHITLEPYVIQIKVFLFDRIKQFRLCKSSTIYLILIVKITPTKDFEVVVATAAKYVENLRVGFVPSLAQALHKGPGIYGFTNGELLGPPIKNLHDFAHKNGGAHQISRYLTCSHKPYDGGCALRHGEGRDWR
jgi:hypothetical protein